MKNLKSTLLTLAAILCSTVASAYNFQVDGIFYNITNYDDSNLTVEVTYEKYVNSSYSSPYTGDVVSPATVTYNDKVYTVTSIGGDAFRDCSSLTSITVPEDVTSISNSAFSSCSSLTSITIPENSKLTTIEYMAFSNCSSLTSITIPDGVTSIGGYAFSNCSNLTSITIPESVTSIGDGAFDCCRSLTDIHIASIESWLTISFRGFASHPGDYASDVILYIDGEKLTEVEVPSSVTSIPNDAFRNCRNITSVTIPEGVTSIGESAFNHCSGLTSITIPESVTAIGAYAFEGCSSLTSITIPEGVTSIGESAFNHCSGLTSITIPEGVTSIGSYAFGGCSSLTSIILPESVTSIGYYAFDNCSRLNDVVLKSTTPPALTELSVIPASTVFVVPEAAYEAYLSASYWKDLASQITIDDANARVKSVALTAGEDKSALHMAIGDANLKYVTNLTISGSINSYDFMVLRNKMPLLRHLDLSEASIVANDYEHYTGCHTEDNKFPSRGLYECKLLSLELPNNITTIGAYAISGNRYLTEIIIPEGVTLIADDAISNCSSLTSITIPEGVTTIGQYAFAYCGFGQVVLPPTVKTIEYYAFQGCSKLTEIRIPSSIREIGNYAFYGCSNLTDVYVYTVEPISIGDYTFTKKGNNFIATLHAPKVSYDDYYWDTQWSQFASFAEFDEPYDNFYLNSDKKLDDNTGDIRGEEGDAPDAEMGNNSGLIVEDDVTQDLGDVDIEHNGSDGGSIIVGGEGCVNTDELHFHINVQGGRWYFFCFPFDVKREDIVLENGAEWVFRYYDGEERANNGKGGWKNVTSDGNGNHLKAATGYIFQCSKDDVLILTAKNQKLKQEKKYNELVEHVTANMHDASWNFVGNPYLSYYEVTSNDYSAPITVWDGEKYIAIRPGDDDYQLAPFEAFFVQKPEGTANIEYNPGQQMTYTQAQKAAEQARARRRAMPVNPDRLLVNITLGNGTDSDQTRVVFNNSAAMGYETTCDAAKFETAGVPQLYTVDSRAVKYAINERPVAEGIVTVGYTVPTAGNYTLAAPRMDTPICIKDNLTGTIHDFSKGDYTFMTEAGTFEDRFTIMMKADETSIENSEIRNQKSEIYDAAGRRVEKMEQGVYIKDNRKVVKM